MRLVVVAIASSSSPRRWVELPQGADRTSGAFPPPARLRAAAGRDRLRRRGRRAEPVPEQLDPRQGLRHGRVRAAPGQPGHRPGGGGRRRPASRSSRPRRTSTRWRGWWRFANVEQAATFALLSFLTIVLHVDAGVLHGASAGRAWRNASASCRSRARRCRRSVGPWFGVLFWVIGALSLFAAAMGIVDYTSRLAADVLKTVYLRDVAAEREPGLLRAGVGAGRRSAASSCWLGLRPAAGPAGDLGRASAG